MPFKQSWSSSQRVYYSKSAYAINEAYYQDGFNAMLVEGKQREGKTSYSIKVFANAFGEWVWEPVTYVAKPDYESVKRWVTFMPREYLDSILDLDEKVRGIILDDAGLWLYALDWYEPLVKAINKWLQVCGTKFGSVYLTTPDQSLISSKVLSALPDSYICRIRKAGSDRHKYKPRVAKVYQTWTYPDGKKGGVKTKWSDRFDAILPDPVFSWYQPKRQGYLDLAQKMLQCEIVKVDRDMKKKGKTLSMHEKERLIEMDDAAKILDQVTGGESTMTEVGEVLKMIQTEQMEKKQKVKVLA